MIDVIINSKIEKRPEHAQDLTGQGHVYLHLLMALGFPQDQLPLARVLSQMLGLKGEWFILSPVHWQATHNDALIQACGEDLILSEEEGRCWFEALASFLKSDGFELVYFDAHHWLISRNSKPVPASTSVYQMRHRSMFPALSKLDSTMFWQHFITESQMLFSSSQHNHKRLKENKLTINGLWIWGAGSLKPADKVVSTTEAFMDFAKCCATSIKPYGPDLDLQGIDCLLINDSSELTGKQKQQLINSESNWYFNNDCYTLKKTGWWQRFWRRIKNENQTTNIDR